MCNKLRRFLRRFLSVVFETDARETDAISNLFAYQTHRSHRSSYSVQISRKSTDKREREKLSQRINWNPLISQLITNETELVNKYYGLRGSAAAHIIRKINKNNGFGYAH